MESFPATQIGTLKAVKVAEALQSINLFQTNISYKIVHFNKEIFKKIHYHCMKWFYGLCELTQVLFTCTPDETS